MKTTRTTGSARVVREWENLETMVRLFCHSQHHGHELCPECQQLLDYTKKHLESCRFGPEKPVCDNCSFGCYIPACRQKLKTMLSATHSRMLWQHPNLSLRHWLDSFHHAPAGPIHENFTSWGSE
jgi:hypothetical protein